MSTVRCSRPFQPFPSDALPDPVRGFVRAVSESSHCDSTYVALPLLAVLASAVGNSRRIQLRRGWTEPACLWTVSIGESGTGKSIGWEHATQPLVRLQAEHLQDHQRGTPEPAEVPIGSGVPDAVEELLEPKTRSKPGHAPLGFDLPGRWVTSDTTIAALGVLLSDNPRGLLLSRDELAGWFAGLGRNARSSGGSQVAQLGENLEPTFKPVLSATRAPTTASKTSVSVPARAFFSRSSEYRNSSPERKSNFRPLLTSNFVKKVSLVPMTRKPL